MIRGCALKAVCRALNDIGARNLFKPQAGTTQPQSDAGWVALLMSQQQGDLPAPTPGPGTTTPPSPNIARWSGCKYSFQPVGNWTGPRVGDSWELCLCHSHFSPSPTPQLQYGHNFQLGRDWIRAGQLDAEAASFYPPAAVQAQWEAPGQFPTSWMLFLHCSQGAEQRVARNGGDADTASICLAPALAWA